MRNIHPKAQKSPYYEDVETADGVSKACERLMVHLFFADQSGRGILLTVNMGS